MKQFLMLLLFSFALFINMEAQEDSKARERSWYMSIGAHGVNMSDFNNSIQGNGLASLPATNLVFGFGWHDYVGKYLIGFDMLTHTSATVSGSQFRSSMSNINSGITAGYRLYETSLFSFYPTVGIGLGISTFTTESIDLVASNLVNALQIQSTRIGRFYGVIPVALNADFYIGKKSAKTLLGLTAGYNLAFGNGNWRVQSILGGFRSNRTIVEGIGDFTPSGFFVTAKIGIAY